VPLADTLRQGEFGVGLHSLRLNRDPGVLDFSCFPISFSAGLHDRVEFFASFEAYKRVRAEDHVVYKIPAGETLIPAQLASVQAVGYFNDAPFLDVGFGDGVGDFWAGLKMNLLSERRNAWAGLAVQPIARIRASRSRQHLLKGLNPGVSDFGTDIILSKRIAGSGAVTGTVGFLSGRDVRDIDRQNSINWGVGAELPLGRSSLQFLGEVIGTKFYGQKRFDLMNIVSPLDAYAGLRIHPKSWLTVSSALSFHLQNAEASGYDIPGSRRLGWAFQVAFQQKINRPPEISCQADRSSVLEGEEVKILAEVTDVDDDFLWISWRSSGGHLVQEDHSATLHTNTLAAGKYSILVEVGDDANVASCMVNVNVEKRLLPPTITCKPVELSVVSGQSVRLEASAADPNGDPLTFAWTVDGDPVPNNQATFQFGTVGRTTGKHVVQAHVSDTDAMKASCKFSVWIEPRTNLEPSVTISLQKPEVYAGEPLLATATASDPDGDLITWAWELDGRPLADQAGRIELNTSGLSAGIHSLAVQVSDGRGGLARQLRSFAVREKLVMPIKGFRLDNKAKALLDKIALRMKQDPLLNLQVTGCADERKGERKNRLTEFKLAIIVTKYLVEQGIGENRILSPNQDGRDPEARSDSEGIQRNGGWVGIELSVR
jgi:hypothetical protein